jgi:hypothetical protein
MISDVGRISIEIEELLYRVNGEDKTSAGLRFIDDNFVVKSIDVSTYFRAYFSANHIHNPLDDVLDMMGRLFGMLAHTNATIPENTRTKN